MSAFLARSWNVSLSLGSGGMEDTLKPSLRPGRGRDFRQHAEIRRVSDDRKVAELLEISYARRRERGQ
jgi:hypothetical protein